MAGVRQLSYRRMIQQAVDRSCRVVREGFCIRKDQEGVSGCATQRRFRHAQPFGKLKPGAHEPRRLGVEHGSERQPSTRARVFARAWRVLRRYRQLQIHALAQWLVCCNNVYMTMHSNAYLKPLAGYGTLTTCCTAQGELAKLY